MKQNNQTNIANTTSSGGSAQSQFYSLFLMATEIDLENIRRASGTGAVVPLISPSLIAILDIGIEEPPDQKNNQDSSS